MSFEGTNTTSCPSWVSGFFVFLPRQRRTLLFSIILPLKKQLQKNNSIRKKWCLKLKNTILYLLKRQPLSRGTPRYLSFLEMDPHLLVGTPGPSRVPGLVELVQKVISSALFPQQSLVGRRKDI